MGKHNNNDYMVFHSKLSVDRMNEAYKQTREILPTFQLGERVQLKDLDVYLTKKYKALKADRKAIEDVQKPRLKDTTSTAIRYFASAKLTSPTMNIIARI